MERVQLSVHVAYDLVRYEAAGREPPHHYAFDINCDTIYCNSIHDNFLCWGPTAAGQSAYQNCPVARLSDPSQLAFRTCGKDGLWLDRQQHESTAGWTNYTACFPADVKNLFEQVYDENETGKFHIARNTRVLEIVGFTVSLFALLISLAIFTRFRSLRNNRTWIHINLFAAMVLHIVVRLILYIDQEFARTDGDYETTNTFFRGIDNMPYICEITYVLLEYGISVMFMWMFIEGLYLNKVVSSSTLRDQSFYLMHRSIGWGIPFILTLLWAVIASTYYNTAEVKTCWYGYNFEKFYWIIQGQRLAIIIINILFLGNIIRVLLVKMRTSRDNELEKLWKAVRATCFLLPLLGITNVLDLCEPSPSGGLLRFASWSYISHFFRSFQGFFVALIYCFMNAEVQTVIMKHFETQSALRETRRRRQMLFRSIDEGIPYDGQRFSFGAQSRTVSEGTQARVPMRSVPWSRSPLHLRTVNPQISMPCIHYFEKRRSTGTETDRDSPVRRYSANASLGRTVVSLERQIPKRRSIGTDTDTDSPVGRCSTNASLGRTVVSLEYERQTPTVSEGTQTRVPMRPVPWSRSPLHLRTVNPQISMPCIHYFEKRRSTGTDMETDSRVRRFSANASLGRTVVSLEHDRQIPTVSESTQTRVPNRPVPWSRSQLHLRSVNPQISMPCIHYFEKRRSTGTDMDSRVRRSSANASLGRTVVSLEHERQIPMTDFSLRQSDPMCPYHHRSYEAETST